MSRLQPRTRRTRLPATRLSALAAMLALLLLPGAAAFAAGSILDGLPPEVPDDPPAAPAPLPPAPARGARVSSTVAFGRFTHVQVNVAPGGANIVGDAANEPSIAVDPTNHDRMVVGWRQFDSVGSNFRQAGYGWSTDGGSTWTMSRIQAGVFRSDPVLGVDGTGRFYYNSLALPANVLTTNVFPSTDGGATWGTGVYAYGGDKQWMAVDLPAGMGTHRLYQAWSTASNPHAPNTFNRSLNDNLSWQAPSAIPNAPVWGTLAAASDGTLYVVGMDGATGEIKVAHSTNAKDAGPVPTFTTFAADLGGDLRTGPPNPAGLLGQLWIGVDRSGGPRDGWVYVLASVTTPDDPMDVHFIRSTDGGATWTAPIRVNDDPAGNGAWQWFGTMSVAPDGRIEAVWNDSRQTGDSTLTALYYSYSLDGGDTWTVNEQASPVWNSMVGFPNQSKIGDYYHMVSDVNGADLAWAATLNGEEDVWYLRIPRGAAAVSGGGGVPGRLHAASPNPFALTTSIRFDVPSPGGRVRLDVLDVGGRRIATLVDGFRTGGSHAAAWDGRDAEGRVARAGVYLCRYEADGRVETRKLMRLR